MIELVKFRVKNYRSIIDSGDCYLANKITVLAGKNESGKSSILEALAIEDVFTKEDFKKYILEAENDYKVSNSKYIKDTKNDKVLLAKKFYEMVEKGDIGRNKLDDETLENIKYIFERLDSAIEEVTKK